MDDAAASQDLSQYRAAQNEVVFRDANERIESRLGELSFEEGRSPFLCECADPACTVILRLTLSEYEQVREDGRCFVIAPRHNKADGQIVRTEPSFWTVRKTGAGGDLAQQTDPRS